MECWVHSEVYTYTEAYLHVLILAAKGTAAATLLLFLLTAIVVSDIGRRM